MWTGDAEEEQEAQRQKAEECSKAVWCGRSDRVLVSHGLGAPLLLALFIRKWHNVGVKAFRGQEVWRKKKEEKTDEARGELRNVEQWPENEGWKRQKSCNRHERYSIFRKKLWQRNVMEICYNHEIEPFHQKNQNKTISIRIKIQGCH